MTTISRRGFAAFLAVGAVLGAGRGLTSAHDGMDHGTASPAATPGLGPTGSGTAEVSLRITNNGGSDDRLLGGETEVAGVVELHQMTMDGNTMSMGPVEGGLAIAAGQTIDFGEQHYHLMLIGLRRDLRPGDSVPLTLEFEQAGKVALTAPVYVNERAAEDAGTGTPVTAGDLSIDKLWARAAPALLEVEATPAA